MYEEVKEKLYAYTDQFQIIVLGDQRATIIGMKLVKFLEQADLQITKGYTAYERLLWIATELVSSKYDGRVLDFVSAMLITAAGKAMLDEWIRPALNQRQMEIDQAREASWYEDNEDEFWRRDAEGDPDDYHPGHPRHYGDR